MNKNENRYNNCKIYKLIDNINNYFYIGSTCLSLSKRLYGHKQKSKLNPNQKIYKYINTIGWDNIKIVLIKELNLNNKEQLLRAENEIIEKHLNDPLCLNSCKPFVSLEEQKENQRKYFQENKDVYHKNAKENYYDNYEYYLTKHKDYYHNNIDYYNNYRKINKDKIAEQKRQYINQNKDYFSDLKHKYYEEHKEEIKAKNKAYRDTNSNITYVCCCGSNIKITNKSKHDKTQKHIKYIENENNKESLKSSNEQLTKDM